LTIEKNQRGRKIVNLKSKIIRQQRGHHFESKSIGKKNVYWLQSHQAAGRGARHLLEKP
jgi:hypothetical protein